MAPPRKPPKPWLSREHVELAETAKRKAGGPAALARIFGVTRAAAGEWGRIRPIPRHLKPRLEHYVKGSGTGSDGGIDWEPAPAPLLELLEVIDPSRMSGHFADLPPGYRKRYERRVSEVIAWVKRELEEYQKVLEAEHRAKAAKRKPRSN